VFHRDSAILAALKFSRILYLSELLNQLKSLFLILDISHLDFFNSIAIASSNVTEVSQTNANHLFTKDFLASFKSTSGLITGSKEALIWSILSLSNGNSSALVILNTSYLFVRMSLLFKTHLYFLSKKFSSYSAIALLAFLLL